jgi:hypothetical protein
MIHLLLHGNRSFGNGDAVLEILVENSLYLLQIAMFTTQLQFYYVNVLDYYHIHGFHWMKCFQEA